MKEKLKGPARKIVYAGLAVSTALIPAAAFAQEHTQPEATHVPAGPRPGQAYEPYFCTNVGVVETFRDQNRRQLTPTEVAALPAFLVPSQPRIQIEADGAEPLQFSIAPDGKGTEIHTNQNYVQLVVNKYRLTRLNEQDGAIVNIVNLKTNQKSSNRFLVCNQQDQDVALGTTVTTSPTTEPNPSPVSVASPATPARSAEKTTAKPAENIPAKPTQFEQKPLAPKPTNTPLSGHGYLPPGAQIDSDAQDFYAKKSFRDLAVEWITVNRPELVNTMEGYHTATEVAGAIALPLAVGLGIRKIYLRIRKIYRRFKKP